MAVITMRELLETGVHFGHQTKRWNPRMKPFIYGERNGIYIIDLVKTMKKFKEAYVFVREAVSDGGSVLFVGTKKQAQNVVYEESLRCGMHYVNHRWLGGMLTNFETVRQSIKKLEILEEVFNSDVEALAKKERTKMEKVKDKLAINLSGIRNMNRLPKVLFVIDPQKERIAVNEARTLKIPVVAIVDTNCDPNIVDYVIPGNDDAIRAIKLITSKIADAVMEGQHLRESKRADDVERAKVKAAPPPESQKIVVETPVKAAAPPPKNIDKLAFPNSWTPGDSNAAAKAVDVKTPSSDAAESEDLKEMAEEDLK